MGAVQFIENLDRTALTISDDEFERHVEASVAAIAERQPSRNLHKDDAQNLLLDTSGNATPPTASQSPSRLEGRDGTGAVQGLIRNIQRPLSNIGRMFSDDHPAGESTANRPDTSVATSDNQYENGDLAQTAASLNEDDPTNDHAVPSSQDVDVEHIVE